MGTLGQGVTASVTASASAPGWMKKVNMKARARMRCYLRLQVQSTNTGRWASQTFSQPQVSATVSWRAVAA